jgi:hypothetical protein
VPRRQELGARHRGDAADRGEPDGAAGDHPDEQRRRHALARARAAQVDRSLVEVLQRGVDRGQPRDLHAADRLALGECGAAR